MGWQLIYVGISAAIGLVGGVITGLICLCDKDYFGLATNSRFFENDFGLYTPQDQMLLAPAPEPGVYNNPNGSSSALRTGNI